MGAMGGLITDNFYLDWAILALSLFNMVLLFWLGGAVILNAERRTWGLALAGGGLLMAGTLFLAHTAILGRGLQYVGRWMDFWWGLGWAPAQAAPFIWYMVMLWYSGFWSDRGSPVRRWHRIWLPLLAALALVQIGLPLFDPHPLPSYTRVVDLRWDSPLSIGTLPVLVLLYPLYTVLCFGLSLHALRRPGSPERVMGDLARRRAWPWLVATALVLLVTSLVGAGTIVWFLLDARQGGRYLTNEDVFLTLAWLDVIVSGTIAVAVLLLGQAIIRYEIFTGKALPRRGFSRHWRSAVALAVGYGVVVGFSLALQLHPIYGLLLATVLMVGFYTLFSWRSYAERDRFMQQLRPFVASQGMYKDVLAATSPSAALPPPDIDTMTPFRALCHNVLGTRMAYLVAVGPLSPLIGQPLVYSEASDMSQPRLPSLHDLTRRFTSPQKICLPVDPALYAGAHWAVPLWSERGLIGVLLFSDKRDGGLFAHEELEIARAIGERLIDTQASLAMAQKLMLLQRQQLAESQVLDRRARRVLHDEVLPLLHTSMLALSGPEARANGHIDDALAHMSNAHSQITGLLREMPPGVSPEVARLGLIEALQRVVQEELSDAFDSVEWHIEPEAVRKSGDISPFAAEVLFYAAREAMRNAARHGRAGDVARPLHLNISIAWHEGLEIILEDNGVGIQVDISPKLSNQSGGQGLALHGTLMAVVGGTLSIERVPGDTTRVTLALPHSDLKQI
jgi:signal transduction histidine kinase